jgi:hypothetical protein
MSTTAWIPEPLREILDYIVDNDPEYSDRSKIVNKATWEWIKKHPLYDDFMRDNRKKGEEKDAALVETTKPEAISAEGTG